MFLAAVILAATLTDTFNAGETLDYDLTWLATDLLALACGTDDPDPDLIAAQFREAVPAGEEAVDRAYSPLGGDDQIGPTLGRLYAT